MCAVLMLLLLGTGAAVVSRVGVLELFFQGDTSQLEPFVQTGASAQDKNYRLTLDSSICDGDTLYVVITVAVSYTHLAHEQWPDAGPDAPVAENHL